MGRRFGRGIVGIEAAIVLIAFVVVAAALAFVALNMGFYTTQRSKEVMAAGLAQASSSLEIDGSVLAQINISNPPKLICMIIPVRLSAGQKPVDLTPNKTQIALWVIGKEAFTNLYDDDNQAKPDPGTISGYDITSLCNDANSSEGVAVVWGPGSNGDTVLDAGEKVLIVLRFDTLGQGLDGGLDPYDVVKVEIKPPIGAALTIERTVPASLNNRIIDLG